MINTIDDNSPAPMGKCVHFKVFTEQPLPTSLFTRLNGFLRLSYGRYSVACLTQTFEINKRSTIEGILERYSIKPKLIIACKHSNTPKVYSTRQLNLMKKHLR